MNPKTKAIALEGLRQGKPLRDIGEDTGLLDKEIRQLADEHALIITGHKSPNGTAPTPARRCAQAGCQNEGTEIAGPWAFCADHVKPHQDQPEQAERAPLVGLISALLDDAHDHSKAAVRSLAKRIEADVERLRTLITEHADAEAAKRRALEERAAAKAKVAQLEVQLRAAKAALRPEKSPVKHPVAADSGETATSPYPCTSCGGHVTRAAGTGGRWPGKCAGCR